MNPHYKKRINKLLKLKYGYMPRVTEYNGKIYVSDPIRLSEPWEVYDNAPQMYRRLNKYENDYKENNPFLTNN